jgi:hypothetical protein
MREWLYKEFQVSMLTYCKKECEHGSFLAMPQPCSIHILISFSTMKGFPQLQVALISNEGFIEAFPIDGLVYETFPKLQFAQKYDLSVSQKSFINGLPCHL